MDLTKAQRLNGWYILFKSTNLISCSDVERRMKMAVGEADQKVLETVLLVILWCL